MRILHILDHSLPVQDGYAYRTLNLMHAQNSASEIIAVAGLTTPRHYTSKPTDTAETFEFDGLSFYRTPKTRMDLPTGVQEFAEMRATHKRIIEVIKDFKPDVLHAHSPILTVIPAIIAARQKGLRIVYEIRAFWEDAAVDMGHTYQGSLRYKITRWLETRVCQNVDAVATICEGLKGDLIKRGLNKPVHVLPNCVNVESFKPIAQTDKDTLLFEKLGLDPDLPTVGFVGSFYDFEGLDILISAIKELSKEGYNKVNLLLVGGGQMDAALRTQAIGYEDTIAFTGRVPQDQVQLYYACIDLLVYPRKTMRLTELVTPLKPLETMALGKPVLASDVGGHRELIEDGKTGLFFKANSVNALKEKITYALTTPNLLQELGQAGRAYVEEQRSWERYPQEIKESGFYSTVLNN